MTVAAEQLADSGAATATTQWQRWSTTMQIVVTDPDSLPVARREVDVRILRCSGLALLSNSSAPNAIGVVQLPWTSP